MKDVKEIFERIQEQKRQQRELNKAVKDALAVMPEYTDTLEQIQKLRYKKFRLEDQARGDMDSKLDLLKLNIKEGFQTMSDVALTKIMKGESIHLKDEFDNEYEPVFSVRFKKTSNRSYKSEKD